MTPTRWSSTPPADGSCTPGTCEAMAARRPSSSACWRIPRGVDTLLMEGTHIGPEPDADPGGRRAMTESQVEADMAATFRSTAGLPVVVSSAQNIDRLVTVYR